MKITRIDAWDASTVGGEPGVELTVSIHLTGIAHIPSAIASVAALFAGASNAVSRDTQSPLAASASEPTADTTQSTGRTRRSRSAAPTAADGPLPQDAMPAETANVTDLGSRRSRRSAATPAAEPAAPVTFTDADLSKAASHAAAAIVAAGFDGPGTIMDLMTEEFGVTDTREIPAERRPEFLKALADEVEASELEAKTKPAKA